MSCRYWSNAPEGLVRKHDLALLVDARAIHGTPIDGFTDQRANLNRRQYRNHLRMVQISAVINITNRYPTVQCAVCPRSTFRVDKRQFGIVVRVVETWKPCGK